MQKRVRYAGVRVRDFQMLAVRLPPNVIERLNAISGGVGARTLLVNMAFTMCAGITNEQQTTNQA